MAAKKKRELVQVKIRLFKDNVDEAKRLGDRDLRPYSAVIRDAVDSVMGKRSPKVR